MNRAAATVALALALCAPAAAQKAADSAAQADDIVVTGRRSGVPIWRVTSGERTLVLVGAIQGISKTSVWDPTALTEALRKADRVMFPEIHEYTASPFSMIGWLAKWKAMASLPKGQSLSEFVQISDMQRLAALRSAGKVRADYERRHPLHLADDLRDGAKGRIDYGSSVASYVRKAVGKYKLTLVPFERSKAKPLVKDLFASAPTDHVACLHDAIALAEAGPNAVQARSDAFVARRVPEVIRSPAQRVWESCWPAGAVGEPVDELLVEMKALLAEPQLTLAVLDLETLAAPNGILDGLEAAGFEIQGPAWKD